jgi:hypothetical protein
MSKSFVSCFLVLLSPKVYGMFRPRQNGIDTRACPEKTPRKAEFAAMLPARQRPAAGSRLEEQEGGFSAYEKCVFATEGACFAGDCRAQ